MSDDESQDTTEVESTPVEVETAAAVETSEAGLSAPAEVVAPHSDFVAVQIDGGLVEMPPVAAQAYLAAVVRADNAERRAGTGATPGGADVPALTKELTTVEQATKIGLHRSTDTKDKGADAYSSVLGWEGRSIFMLEMDADEVTAFEAEGKAIDDDFQLGFKDDTEFTPEVVARVNTVPARRLAYNEKIIAHCARGCLQMHPFNAERQRRLWPSQKMDLANAMLTRSKAGFDFLQLA